MLQTTPTIAPPSEQIKPDNVSLAQKWPDQLFKNFDSFFNDRRQYQSRREVSKPIPQVSVKDFDMDQ